MFYLERLLPSSILTILYYIDNIVVTRSLEE
jgi:hypothetical protein